MDEKSIRVQLRRKFSTPGWVALSYYGIFILIVLAATFFYAIYVNVRIIQTDSSQDFFEMIVQVLSFMLWTCLPASGISCLALLGWKGGKFLRLQIFQPGKPMKIGTLAGLMCLMGAGQALNQLLLLWQQLLSQSLGISLANITMDLGTDTNSLMLFLYICLAAPVVEEILFRGVVARLLVPYGKKLAILGSAFLFGIFHGNLVQAPFAFGIGLVLGYVALEYGILWSMVLHMFNNLGLGIVLPRLLSYLLGSAGNWAFLGLIGGMSLCALLFLFFRREKISAFWKADVWHNRFALCFFTSPGVMTSCILLWFQMARSALTPLLP